MALDQEYFDAIQFKVAKKKYYNARKVDAVLEEFAPKFGIPVYRGFPFGHSPQCFTIDFRRPVKIENNAVTFPSTAR